MTFLAKYKSYKNHHKVYLVISVNEAVEDANQSEPDWFFQQKVRDYFCTCQNGRRLQGSCVHVQCALYGATLTVDQKVKFKRTESMLSTENFKNTFESDDDAEQGEEYLNGE